jgi:hypothetical protein
MIKEKERDSTKEDYFRNISMNAMDSLYEISQTYTESMKSYKRLSLQDDHTVKILFQKNLFETYLYCNKETESGEIKVYKHMNRNMNM